MTNIAARRLQSQLIANPLHNNAVDVVQHIGAIQAQDYQHALWAIGVRMPTATLQDIEAAIEAREIIRTWPMRGTYHFIPAADAQWMLALCAERVLAGHGRRMKQLELTDAVMAQCAEVCHDVLGNGKRLTRPELLQQIEDAGISTDGQRSYHMLWHIAQQGIICLGPMDGKQQTFVLLDDWVPNARQLSPDDALRELVIRFFRGHGPATEADFARWTRLPLGKARQGIEDAGQQLLHEKIADVVYYSTADRDQKATADTAYLLPGFDEYVIGYQDRRDVLAPEHANKIVPGNNGIFKPILVINGQVQGTWQRKVKRKSVDIAISPFEPLSHDHLQPIRAAAERYSAFVGVPIGKYEIMTP